MQLPLLLQPLSPDPGTSAPATPLHFAGIALKVSRGKSESDRLPFPQTETIVQHEIANVSLASSFPLPPGLCESASIVSPATVVETTFDRSLCVETFSGMSLGPEVEAVLSDTRASRGCDASVV